MVVGGEGAGGKGGRSSAGSKGNSRLRWLFIQFLFILGLNLHVVCRFGLVIDSRQRRGRPFLLCCSIRTCLCCLCFHQTSNWVYVLLADGWWWRPPVPLNRTESRFDMVMAGLILRTPIYFFHSIGDVIGGERIKSYYLWKEFREKWPNETVFNG